MIIKGHGIDVIELARITVLISRDDEFVAGWFTVQEIEELGTRKYRAETIGGRVAAKEAAVKALGTGFAGDVSWQDIQVKHLENGAPQIVLSGGALRIAHLLGITDILISISHTATMAVASAIAVSNEPVITSPST